jgi:hypothetical protein
MGGAKTMTRVPTAAPAPAHKNEARPARDLPLPSAPPPSSEIFGPFRDDGNGPPARPQTNEGAMSSSSPSSNVSEVLLLAARDELNLNADDLSHSAAAWKKLAVHFKKKGDISTAKHALLRAKQIEKRQKEEEQRPREEYRGNDAGPGEPHGKEGGEPTKQPQNAEESGPPKEDRGETEQEEKPPQPDDEEASAKEGGGGEEEECDDEELNALLGGGSVTFTDEEMKDEEMMTMFRLENMPGIPTDDEYRARILSHKREALALKNAGDVAGARQQLQTARQLDKVRIALSHMNEGLGLRIHDDRDGWLEELNQADSAAVGEILDAGSRNAGGVQLDVDELLEMSSAEIRDAVDMGMELPSVEDILSQANEKKALAIQCKRDGQLDQAKAALLESKRLSGAAVKLQSVPTKQQQGDKGEQDISMEALESLLDDSTNKATGPAPKQQQQQKEPKEAASPPLTTEELKQEAIRLRNEGHMAEATRVFKMYKEALKKEADIAEKRRCQEIVENIRREVSLAQQQQSLFRFYERFVDAEAGASQMKRWNDYARQCEDAADLMEKRGSSNSLIVSRRTKSGLSRIEDDMLTDVLECGAEESEERLEVAILDLRNMDENKTFHKLRGENESNAAAGHVLRVDVTIQIPPSEEERDHSVELVFESDPSFEFGSEYRFGSSRFVNVPRGDSKFAEIVRRRMEKRKIQISVHYAPLEEKRKGSWFGGRSGSSKALSSAEENPPSLLGKVVLELNELLKRNCVAGDFPLTYARKAVGGSVGLVLRTGVPIDAEQRETVSARAALVSHEVMSFSLSTGK